MSRRESLDARDLAMSESHNPALSDPDTAEFWEVAPSPVVPSWITERIAARRSEEAATRNG